MKKYLWIVLGAALVGGIPLVTAQSKSDSAKYEYAVVKWDGPDRLFYNLPGKFEMVHLKQVGAKVPGEAQEEEWCLAYGANKMAAEGWEAVNLDSRRILFRRAR